MSQSRSPGERSLRYAIVETGKRLYDAGLVAGTDGNISVRLGQRHLLVTPTGVAKGKLTPRDVVVVDLLGRVVGPGSASSELGVHLCIYRNRPDVGAVVHAHPPWAIAASIQTGVRFDFAPEAIVALGGVQLLDYARPGTSAVVDGLEEVVAHSNSFILARHGAVAVGEDVEQASMRMEALEHTSKIAVLALIGGELTPLPMSEVQALRGGAEPASSTSGEIDAIRGSSEIAISDEEALVRALVPKLRR
jgi:L-fuculose-phosphate aldolase